MNAFVGEQTTFHFNSDFSGNVLLVDQKTNETFVVKAEELLSFVAQFYVVPKRIEQLLGSNYNDVLK